MCHEIPWQEVAEEAGWVKLWCNGGGQAVLVLERCYASLASPPESAQCHSLPLMMSSHLATVDLGRAAELGACWG